MKRTQATILAAILIATALPARADTRYVICQSRPTDCGPAALATLLRYYLDVPTDEPEAMRLARYEPIRGTTLLGLEEAATAKGCAAGSYRMSYPTLKEQIATYPAPVIVRLLNPEPHFVVLLAVDRGRIFLADPAAGNIVMSRDAFLHRWYAPDTAEGFVLIVAAPGQRIDHAHLQETVVGLQRSLSNLKAPGLLTPLLR